MTVSNAKAYKYARCCVKEPCNRRRSLFGTARRQCRPMLTSGSNSSHFDRIAIHLYRGKSGSTGIATALPRFAFPTRFLFSFCSVAFQSAA